MITLTVKIEIPDDTVDPTTEFMTLLDQVRGVVKYQLKNCLEAKYCIATSCPLFNLQGKRAGHIDLFKKRDKIPESRGKE